RAHRGPDRQSGCRRYTATHPAPRCGPATMRWHSSAGNDIGLVSNVKAKRWVSDHVGIALIDAGLRRRIGRARVGHFATSDGREPALVPVCLVLLGDTLYHAIDAKPKSAAPGRLRRVRNVRAHPFAAVLVHHDDGAGRQ